MFAVIRVYALPKYVAEEELADDAAVVIDVLRASTTMVTALASGAREIIPCQEVDEARQIAAKLPAEECLLGGERDGLPIEGFHLGNSPGEYSAQKVAGKTIVFTTSNGTRALWRARKARRVLVAAFVNASAVITELAGEDRIHLICAGADGRITHDDVLLAGMLVGRLQALQPGSVELNAQAVTAYENWTYTFPLPYSQGAEPMPPELLARQLRKGSAGQRLMDLGREDDILAAAQINRFGVVPEFFPHHGRIRALPGTV